jgi:hypothetical protein
MKCALLILGDKLRQDILPSSDPHNGSSAEALDATWMTLTPMTREVPVWMIKEDEQLHPKADTRDFPKGRTVTVDPPTT